MIEELKALLDAVADMPILAVAVAGGYLLYKLLLAGSMVTAGVICFKALMATVDKLNEERTAQTRLAEAKEFDMGGITIGCEALLRQQLSRLPGKRSGGGYSYIHDRDVHWLCEAIDEKEARESAQEKAA